MVLPASSFPPNAAVAPILGGAYVPEVVLDSTQNPLYQVSSSHELFTLMCVKAT